MDNPCRYCTYETGRGEGCHSRCEKYKAYKQELNERNENISKNKQEFKTFDGWVRQQRQYKFHGR